MKILSALNAFKGSPANVIALNEAVKSEFEKMGYACEIFPLADGGDGTTDVFIYNLKDNCQWIEVKGVRDALGKLVDTKWLFVPKNESLGISVDTAFVELAKASGLAMIEDQQINPLIANTYGTGELVLDAIKKGCKKIFITVGGSATVDCGLGLLQALGAKFFINKVLLNELKPQDFSEITALDLTQAQEKLKSIELVFLCDVENPLIDHEKAKGAWMFMRQKFTTLMTETEKLVGMEILQDGLRQIANLTNQNYQLNNSEKVQGTGAAGGVAYLFNAVLKVPIRSGVDYLADWFNLREKISQADFVISGEGAIDEQTFQGKAVSKVIDLAREYQKKVIIFCGAIEKELKIENYGINEIVVIKPKSMSVEESIKNTETLLREKVREKFYL